MRAIPSELLDRVKKKWQVPAENADPAMKVYLSRGFINELFQVFTIQEGTELTDVDVTVKRTDTSAEPAEAFALAINDGVAQVKSKPLPYDDQIPWVSEFTVASGVSAVAIEFDGYWDRDYESRRFNFVTEVVPWLFYVISGSLYAQYWQDEAFVLATDVVKVCAIRGWLPANGDQSNDQGLIVAYIKTDGLVYYRSYCIQEDLSKVWEVERNMAEVVATATDLALFRTNDFRIGFLVTISGTMYWLLTARNYAGMSVWPDIIQPNLELTSIEIVPVFIETVELYEPDEIIETSNIVYGLFNVGLFDDTTYLDTEISVVKAERISDYEFFIEFSHPIGTFDESWILNGISSDYTVAEVEIVDDRLYVKTAEVTELTGFSCTLSESIVFCIVHETCKKLIPTIVVPVSGAVPPVEEIILSTFSFSTFDMSYLRITYIQSEEQEETVNTTYEITTFTATYVRISDIPL